MKMLARRALAIVMASVPMAGLCSAQMQEVIVDFAILGC